MAESAALCEYLASYGFVVAGTISVGTTSLRPERSARYLSTQVQDLQFVLGQMRNDARVDHGQISVVGVGAGGISGTLLAMQDSRIGAVTVLSATGEALALMERSPYYDAQQLRTRLLAVTTGPASSADAAWSDPYVFADRYWAPRADSASAGLTHYAWIASLVQDSTGVARRATTAMHNAACLDTRLFLSGELAATAEDEAQTGMVFRKPAEEAPPTADQLRGILESPGPAAAAELFDRFGLARAQPPVFGQRYLNNTGYRLLGTGRPEEAVVVFRMCTEIYPHSANAWDSYGDGLEQAGQIEAAIASYRRLLEVIPTDSTADARLLEQLREHAEEAIPRLEGTTNQ